jgi:CRP/FNR family transcriptional activator FtrB
LTLREPDLIRLSALPLFRGVSAGVLHELGTGAFLQRFPSGTTLLREGDLTDFLYVLFDGTVELQAAWRDRETTLAMLKPTSTFVLASAVLDTPTLMTARTIERSEILMLSGEGLRAAMKTDGVLAVAVAEELAGCYLGVVRTVKNQKLRSGIERLANFLLAQSRRAGEDRFMLPFDKRLLASLLGMTPETLSRSLVALTRYHVEVRGPEVILNRPQVLERLARPSPLIDNHMPPPDQPFGKGERERWPHLAALGLDPG